MPTKMDDEAARPNRSATNARMFDESAPVVKRARTPAPPLEPAHDDFAPPTKSGADALALLKASPERADDADDLKPPAAKAGVDALFAAAAAMPEEDSRQLFEKLKLLLRLWEQWSVFSPAYLF